MKFFRIFLLLGVLIFSFQSCKKEGAEIWNTDVKAEEKPVELIDISKQLYDPNISTADFNAQYPWFQGTVTDEAFEVRRKNPHEIKVYQDALAKIDQKKLQSDLAQLFARVKHYFPKFIQPKVYLFSSSTQMYQEPIIFDPQQALLFIDISSFMGSNDPVYKGMEEFIKKGMNPENLLPRVSETVAISIVPFDRIEQKFLNLIVHSGKVMTLQDAFLPATPDHLKMSLTKAQYDWSVAHEAEIWNYFVENDLVYSPDPRLVERFIAPGPFSKFYTQADSESAPQVGVFTGWQIARHFFNKYPDTDLQEFVKMNAPDIFTKSEYKPQ